MDSNPTLIEQALRERGEFRPPSLDATYITFLATNQYLWQCRNCEWTLEATTDEPVEHVCGRKEVTRLGDRIESGLESIGITKERWISAKEKLGLPPTCRCPEKKRWINDLDEYLGLGEKLTAFKALLNWRD